MAREGKLLEVQDLQKNFGKKDNITKALNGVSFDILPGEFLGIMGPSGSGKTTLLNCIATIIKPTAGRVLLNGKNISAFDSKDLAEYRGSRIGYLFQDFALLDNLTGQENILLPLSIHGVDFAKARAKLDELASFFEITDILHKFPSQMSGGQKQRVAAARSLISDPDIVLADEPTGALDTRSAKILMNKLEGINRSSGKTILMVSHDPNAASFCSRILFIQDGVIFHELRRKQDESREKFYDRILKVLAQLGEEAQMFYRLIYRNANRSRKENLIYFATLVTAVASFYIILSLGRQDVILFLKEFESDAIDKLLSLMPLVYLFALFLLFFLILFANQYQLNRRSKEFGLYLMLGMRKERLVLQLAAEGLMTSILALIGGILIGGFLAEIISLTVSKLVGQGIIGHQISLSVSAIIFTIIGFLFIQLIALVILGGRLFNQEVHQLLYEQMDKKQDRGHFKGNILHILVGIVLLGVAYWIVLYRFMDFAGLLLFVALALGCLGTIFL